MPRLIPKARTALLIFLLGVGLTFASLRYKEPANCNQLCNNDPCRLGACKAGEQTAGFPLPFVRDQESHVGTSPTGVYGIVGFEDYFSPDIKAFWLDVLFYSAIVWSLTLLGKSLRTRL